MKGFKLFLNHHRTVRQKSASVFHTQLCISTFFLLLVLLVGINSTENVAGCVAVGTLLHYFLLANWMWFGTEAGHLLIRAFFIFYSFSYKYLTILSLISWGELVLLIHPNH